MWRSQASVAALAVVLMASVVAALPPLSGREVAGSDSSSSGGLEHACIHDEIVQANVLVVEPGYGKGARAAARGLAALSNPETIRIHFDTSFLDADAGTCYTQGTEVPRGPYSDWTCRDTDVFTAAKRAVLTSLLAAAQARIEKAVLVERVTSDLTLSLGMTCGSYGGISIPAGYSASNADLVIFVTARPVSFLGSTVAYAVTCHVDSDGRPISGHLNFGPNWLDGAAADNEKLVGVMMHEVIHVLGFTSSNLATTGTTYNDGSLAHAVTLASSPNVLAAAQQHFACDSLLGLEIENGGGYSTAGSHWEKRIMYNDVMAGSGSVAPVLSNMTLAQLRDFGWYDVDPEQADWMPFGKDQGCDFVTKRCSGWTGELATCDTPDVRSCSWDHRSKAYCPYHEYDCDTYSSTVCWSAWHRYFEPADAAGSSSLNDYCSHYIPYSAGACTVPSNAQDVNTDFYLGYDVKHHGEEYCETCRCYDSTMHDPVYLAEYDYTKGSCHNTTCLGDDQVMVAVDGIWYDCSQAGRALPRILGPYRGTLRCPRPDAVCDPDTPVDLAWPVFTSITPRTGPAFGTIRLTVTGERFTNDTRVSLDRVLCTNTTVMSPTMLTCTMAFMTDYTIDADVHVLVWNQWRNAIGEGAFHVWATEPAPWLVFMVVFAAMTLAVMPDMLYQKVVFGTSDWVVVERTLSRSATRVRLYEEAEKERIEAEEYQRRRQLEIQRLRAMALSKAARRQQEAAAAAQRPGLGSMMRSWASRSSKNMSEMIARASHTRISGPSQSGPQASASMVATRSHSTRSLSFLPRFGSRRSLGSGSQPGLARAQFSYTSLDAAGGTPRKDGGKDEDTEAEYVDEDEDQALEWSDSELDDDDVNDEDDDDEDYDDDSAHSLNSPMTSDDEGSVLDRDDDDEDYSSDDVGELVLETAPDLAPVPGRPIHRAARSRRSM